MKKLISIVIVLAVSSNLIAQQIIENPSFEDNVYVNGPLDPCDGGTQATPFYDNNKVPNWFSSHGSAQMKNPPFCGSQQDGDYHAFMTGGSNLEGIFQEGLDLKVGNVVTLSFYASGDLTISLTNNLQNQTHSGSNISIPSPMSEQILYNGSPNGTGYQHVVLHGINIANDYDQIWIRCPSGSLEIDNIKLFKSCCNLNSAHIDQNTINPPSRYVGDYIHAGENVISNITAGQVIITDNVDSVVYQAGNSIELFPGFSVEEGANFVARIKYCNKAPLTVYIDSMAVENPTCSTKYSASACGGSGEYSFSWSNNIGDANKPERTQLLSFENNQTITVTVTDLITNETDTRSIFRVKSPFYGDFSFSEYPGSIITPNGDNDNDYFMLVDSARLGKNNFGYNAYGYKLMLQDKWNASWNGLWYSGYVEDTINGFSFNELNPSYNYCSENVDNYTWHVRFYNCKGNQYWFGTFGESGCGTFPNDETSTNFETNNKIVISPNPFSSILQIDITGEPSLLRVETLNGRVVHTQKLMEESNSINLSFLVSGVYSISILDFGGQIVKREKVVKI